MDWDNELNDISEMAERFNNIEENILVKLSEVRDKLDSYDEDDVGDFETLEALTVSIVCITFGNYFVHLCVVITF